MSVVHFNVGGKRFSTSTTTLNRDPCSMLATMLKQDHEKNLINQNQEIFIDRNGGMFKHILDYLRDGTGGLCLPQENMFLEKLLKEADFFQLNELASVIKQKLGDLQNRQPIFVIGSSVKFRSHATTSVALQEYLDMMNKPNYVDVKFGPDMQDRLKPVPCIFCNEPAAQKLPSPGYTTPNSGNSNLSKYHAILLAMWGQVCSKSDTCCLVKFIYPKYMSAVVLKQTGYDGLYFEHTPVDYIYLHIPILFLESL